MGAETLDCKGLRCPLPIVELSLAIRKIATGESITIEATDPAFVPDLTAWCEISGNTLLQIEEGEVTKAVIRKAVA